MLYMKTIFWEFPGNSVSFLQDFLVILKYSLQKIMNKCSLGTNWIVMLSGSNLQPQIYMLTIDERVNTKP